MKCRWMTSGSRIRGSTAKPHISYINVSFVSVLWPTWGDLKKNSTSSVTSDPAKVIKQIMHWTCEYLIVCDNSGNMFVVLQKNKVPRIWHLYFICTHSHVHSLSYRAASSGFKCFSHATINNVNKSLQRELKKIMSVLPRQWGHATDSKQRNVCWPSLRRPGSPTVSPASTYEWANVMQWNLQGLSLHAVHVVVHSNKSPTCVCFFAWCSLCMLTLLAWISGADVMQRLAVSQQYPPSVS